MTSKRDQVNQVLSRLLPSFDEPDIFKPVIRGKKQKKASGVFISSSSGQAKGLRKASVYKQGSGLTPVKKAQDLVNHSAEVLIKVDKASTGIKTKGHLMEAAMYIARNGALDVEDSDGNLLIKETARGVIDIWSDLNGIQEAATEKDPAVARRFIVSCPSGTDPQKVLSAARQFGQEFFKDSGFDYIMVLHHKSENTPNEPDHPHVHFLVNAMSDYGERLNIRKADLKFMRERFAAIAQSRGIELNATDRSVRGKDAKGKSIERYYHEKRLKQGKGKPHPYQVEREQALVSALSGEKPLKEHPNLTKAKKRRSKIKEDAKAAVSELRASGEKSLVDLADKLERYYQDMPNLRSSQERLLEALQLPDEQRRAMVLEELNKLMVTKIEALARDPNSELNQLLSAKQEQKRQAQKWAIDRKKKELSKTKGLER